MAELSFFWNTGTSGDGTNTITSVQTRQFFASVFTPVSGATVTPNTSQGVFLNAWGSLAVTTSVGAVLVATGAALVAGFAYINDAAVTVSIPTPTTATRIDRIVLRASHSANTVRITRLAGTEGGAAPALTQNTTTWNASPSGTWEIPLAQVSITTGGVITLTDQRTYCQFATAVGSGMLADGSVTEAKLATDAVTAVKIAANAVTTVKIASGAVTDTKIASGAVTDTKIATDAVTTAKILNANVTAAKLAAGAATDNLGVRRQGGSATAWASTGTSNYTPSNSRWQFGRINIPTSSAVSVTFPTAFANTPIILCEVGSVSNITASGFNIAASSTPVDVAWLAIGPV